MTLTSLVLSLQSLFDQNPLRFEPGYEGIAETDTINKSYNDAIEYFNIKLSVLDVLTNPPQPAFLPQMRKLLSEHLDDYNNVCREWKKRDSKDFMAVYSMPVKAEYGKAARKLQKHLKNEAKN